MQPLMSIMTEGPLFVVCKHSSVEKVNKVYPVLGKKKVQLILAPCTQHMQNTVLTTIVVAVFQYKYINIVVFVMS